MPRNRSEKSPSGDPMVDDYLRAWLRWYRHINNDVAWEQAGYRKSRVALREEKDRTLELLSSDQKRFMNETLAAEYSLSKEDVFRLYGHEPEFTDATK